MRRFQSRPYAVLLAVVLLAALARAGLLLSGSVSFHADEAIVGLMARHILQGERPVFFYGQAYMGSLDAWLVALGFRLLGESVLVIRLVQSALYLLAVASGYWAAWRLSDRITVAAVAGIVLAVPPVMVALYTTATLGGYNETLILGNLLLILGYDVTHDHTRSVWRWALIGACAGLGFWANALIVAYALPVGLLGLRYFSRRQMPYYALAALAFVIFSAPWWIFDFTHDHAALAMFTSSQQTGEFAGVGIPSVSPGQRALGLIFLGLPTLIGLRFPWSGSYFLVPVGVFVLGITAVAIYNLARKRNPLKPDARALVLGMLGLFCVIFVASHFGADPTGRYFLPMMIPLAIVFGTLADTIRARWGSQWTIALVVLLTGYFAAGQMAAASRDPGFTTQFDPVSHLSNAYDDELITFLDEHELYHGYTNYWVAFRLAFLTDERMQYSAALPYKEDLSYNAADKRYKPYVEATAHAARVAYITTNLPELDDLLAARLAAHGITYRTHGIGPFRIYYDLSEPVTPAALKLPGPAQTDEVSAS